MESSSSLRHQSTMASTPEKSRKSVGIIATREHKKEFDAAVREVMRQRKAAQTLQNAARQSQKKARPGLQRRASETRNLVDDVDNQVNNNKSGMRRATVGYGSAQDLRELERLRAAHRRDGGGVINDSGNNAAVVNKWQAAAATAKRVHHRSSTGDISDRSSNNSEGERKSGRNRNILSLSMSASDEVKKDVMREMNKKEGFPYAPMKKRVTSQSLISSMQSPRSSMGALAEEPSYKRNDSWTLSQDPKSTSSSPRSSASLCGIPGIRLEDLVPTRIRSNNENGLLDNSGRSGTSAGRHDGIVNQWKSKSLMMYPPQTDFDLGRNSANSSSDSLHENSPNRKTKSSTRDQLPPSAVKHTDDGDCPRRKFALLSSEPTSKSGGTGSTSRGSIFSSRGSLNEPNTNPDMVPSIAAIDEEERPRVQGGLGDEQSIQSNSSKFSLKSLRSRTFRRSRRLSQIRMSISNSLMGKNAGVPLVVNHGQHIGDETGSDNIIPQSQSSRISTLDAEKVRRHLLERKPSAAQSITSAYSTVSQTSSTKNENTLPGWRFRLRKGGMRNQSMSAISVERQSRRSSHGSRRSMDSGWLDDESSSGCSFTEFYDNELHAGLMRSMMSKSSSARSLGLSLPTVVEGEQNGGQHQLNVEERKEEETIDDVITSELLQPKNKIDASDRSDDTADSLYRHPAHDHPLLHLRPNQLFPHSPGWRCDLCTQDTMDLNKWAYVSTGKNYLLCERCFCQDGVSIVTN